ncbi:hypothetical protein BO70DRAFT_317882 [Aspergillus heteromorphus CBS 117.55]|uniref:LipA and NB-ARC domain protein n=1 Tax=Aspergillus heteromorphus CBS 117.55 TaxID=1448321 RepID=A0A317VRQ5_9EURO|nr:uncharacterized protein BO70DRAFT_317882 [Aspergillus heteromorphus CBS 117.55]PWY77006.1 hypothetical protein BO70DRAFT_317882 [Aspergillus heteromorphus CBS 117.55]
MPTDNHIKRKPVPQPSADGTVRGVIALSTSTPREVPSLLRPGPQPQPPPEPEPRSRSRLQPPLQLQPGPQQQQKPPYHHHHHHNHSPHPPPAYAPRHPQATKTHHPSAAQKAYSSTLYFLGGLIAHPTNSTKQHTILRHSPGVIFYRGSTTSLTLSLFSSTPLPADRTLWLQSKGWSGKTGMRTKALLHLTDSWLEVTPTLPAQASQVDPADERAWQRDIAKFRKKATGRAVGHVLRETVVVRVPVEAGDGYFQVVLCGGGGERNRKKVLCYSPVFRVLSTSYSPSSVRGASLATMPLEVGALVLGMYAQTAAEAVVAPVTAAVKGRVKAVQPSWVKETAVQTVYEVSGAGGMVGEVLRRGDGREVEGGYQMGVSEEGPKAPFPVDFTARVDGDGGEEGGRLRLRRVPDAVAERYHGFFFGWARMEVGAGPWLGVILSIVYWDPTQETRVNLSQAMTKVTTLRFIDDPILPAGQSRLQIRLMGFLRPDIPPPRGQTERELIAARDAAAEAAMLADACDVAHVQGILEHPAWAAESLVSRADGNSSWSVENVKYHGQRLAGKMPLHWVGVRAQTAEVRDKKIAVNGFYIVRG